MGTSHQVLKLFVLIYLNLQLSWVCLYFVLEQIPQSSKDDLILLNQMLVLPSSTTSQFLIYMNLFSGMLFR